MDFEDEDIFMDIDAKLLSSGQDRIFPDEGNMEISAKIKRGFECKNKNISKSLQCHSTSLIAYVNEITSSSSSILLCDSVNDYIILYDYVFEKSTALSQSEVTDELFNFTFTNIYELDMMLTSQNKSPNSKQITQNVLSFFQYIVQYVDQYLTYHRSAQDATVNIWNNFHQLKLSLKELRCVGTAMITNQSICHQQFHLYLNIHLYYLVTCYKLLSIQKGQDDTTQCTQYMCDINRENTEPLSFNFNSLRNDILLLMIQLTELTLRNFNKITQLEDLYHLSPFKCDCIAEFWFVLKLVCRKIDGHGNNLFWKNLETVFELMEKSLDQEIKDTNDNDELPSYIICSKPYLYFIWFLKHLFSLNVISSEIHSTEHMAKFNDDCDSTEKIVKKLTNLDNISENELRIILTFLDSIVSLKEVCKPDIIIALWEYFHKRLNSNFVLKSMPFAYTLSCLNSNRSVLEVLTHVEQMISSTRIQKNEENSYTLFLRMLGIYLLKYNHEQRIWNQVKGRMYSKFSQNKLSTLSEQGIQHVSNLFILLFYIKGNQELVKIQTFLNSILTIKDKDTISHTAREIVLKTNLTFVLINIRNNVSIDATILSPVLNLVNQNLDNPNGPNYEKLMKIYLQTVMDVIKESDDLTLGQHLLLGAWIRKLLDNSKVSSNVMNIFYNLFTLVLTKLRPYQPVQKDSQMGMYFTCILEFLPNLRTDLNFNPDTMQTMTEFLSALTLFTLSGGVNYKSEATQILNKLVVNSKVNFELKLTYVKCLLSNEDMQSYSLVTFIPNIETIITQCYLLSLILSEHSDGDGMSRYVQSHCLHKLRQNYIMEDNQFTQAQVIHSSNEETLKQLLRDINLINNNITNIESKIQFHSEINTLFGIEETLKCVVNSHDKNTTITGKTMITNIFTCVAIIIDSIGGILYKKSKPNTPLQCFIDTLLLQFQVRNPDFKLTANTTHALRVSFYIYINALMKLDPSNDMYIARTIKELIQVYLPRLVNKIQYETPFSLIKCFNTSPTQDVYLLDVILSLFLRKKCKVSDKNAHECLVFLQEVLIENSSVEFITRFIKASLDLLLNNMISLNDIDVCKNKIKSILIKCFSNPSIQSDAVVKNHVLIVLTKLSNENLAFSFGQFFQVLNFLLHSCCPSIVTEFRRNILLHKIKAVEMKRGVEEDKVLRNHLDQLDRNIKKILLVKS
ncbi:hypothetical protein M8J75_016517 [Diaphorina citri]|nr:hypothetical protein M8J75_016517 [Diaphorina citri]